MPVAVAAETHEHEARPRARLPLDRREFAVELVVGGLFIASAVALAVLGHGTLWHWDTAVALVLAFALTLRAQFDVGTGYVPPTQLVFVPMLFLVSPQYAPLLALVGWAVGRLADVATRSLHPSRLLLIPGNCWFAVGPALVLTLAGSSGPSWSDWPLYLLALVAQFSGDVIANAVRDRVVFGVTPDLQLRILGFTWGIDLVLSPIGLLAAFASEDAQFAFYAVLPLAMLLSVFSHERTRRFDAELANTRAREALIAGASHELQTPISVISGVTDTLARTPHLSGERRAASYETLQRQAAHLRHLVGQFVDYARLKAGQQLLVSVRPTDVAATVQAVGDLWARSGVRVQIDTEPVSAMADPARLHSVLMSLVSNAVRHGPPQGPVELRCRVEGRRAVAIVADRGPGIAEERLEEVFDELATVQRTEGTGIGLFLARTSLRTQRGDVRLGNRPEGGLVATVYLPLAP